MSRLSDEDIVLAGEYVLGLLDPAESATANARIATDAQFSAEVEAWRTRLQSMAIGADIAAPERVWSRIEQGLPSATGQDRGNRALRLWQSLTALSATVAAFFAFLVWNQQPPATIAPPAPLVAALGGGADNTAVTARYDAGSGELLLTPVSLDTGELYPELWIIPSDGVARSLGIIGTGKSTRVVVAKGLRQHLMTGATLAITPEPQGGAPGGKATGPVIASGKITTI